MGRRGQREAADLGGAIVNDLTPGLTDRRGGQILDESGEVVGEGLAVVALNAGAFAGQDSVQGVACGELGGEAAAAQGLASPVEAGQVDGKGSTAVTALRQGGAAGAEPAACGVAAAAAAVDTSPVGIPGHRSSLRPAGPDVLGRIRACVGCDHVATTSVVSAGQQRRICCQVRCSRPTPSLVSGQLVRGATTHARRTEDPKAPGPITTITSRRSDRQRALS